MPDRAKAARVSGAVILDIIVNEAGEVYEVRVLQGHPLLDEAAIDAVKQWRYAPTYLNGQPVPVIVTVKADFTVRGDGLNAVLDKSGNLRDPISQLEGAALVQKMKESKGTVTLVPNDGVPTHVIEETLRTLQREGIQNLRVPGFVFRDGRLFASVEAVDAAPVLALDSEFLTGLARSSGFLDSLSAPERVLLYRIFINEVSEIVGIEQIRGPRIPTLENELMHTRVVSPGRRGADPVPVFYYVEITVP